MSFYVERYHDTESVDGRTSWTGPIRSEDQAHREAEAWESAGWRCVVHESSPAVRARVYRWNRAKRPARSMLEA
jgi:hypothetical protein